MCAKAWDSSARRWLRRTKVLQCTPVATETLLPLTTTTLKSSKESYLWTGWSWSIFSMSRGRLMRLLSQGTLLSMDLAAPSQDD